MAMAMPPSLRRILALITDAPLSGTKWNGNAGVTFVHKFLFDRKGSEMNEGYRQEKQHWSFHKKSLELTRTAVRKQDSVYEVYYQLVVQNTIDRLDANIENSKSFCDAGELYKNLFAEK